MRVLVCGGRNYDDPAEVFARLEERWHRSKHDCMIVLQGGATGADKFARHWCSTTSVPYINYPANWTMYGKAAGPIRNQRMIDEGKPDLVIAFPGGKGTADMVRRAKAAGIETIEVLLASRRGE